MCYNTFLDKPVKQLNSNSVISHNVICSNTVSFQFEQKSKDMLSQLVASGKLGGPAAGDNGDNPENDKATIIKEQILEEFNNQKQLRKQLQKLESEVGIVFGCWIFFFCTKMNPLKVPGLIYQNGDVY